MVEARLSRYSNTFFSHAISPAPLAHQMIPAIREIDCHDAAHTAILLNAVEFADVVVRVMARGLGARRPNLGVADARLALLVEQKVDAPSVLVLEEIRPMRYSVAAPRVTYRPLDKC